MDITIGLVQFEPEAGDLQQNLVKHLQAVEVAAQHDVHLLIFPELSLSGYEPSLAESLSKKDISGIKVQLAQAATDNNISLVAGMPLRNTQGKPYIGALLAQPECEVKSYRKQHLHPGEETHFVTGSEGLVIECRGRKVALAVCADFCHTAHQHQAVELGADLYVISALISHQGYAKDSAIFKQIATANQLPVLMCNYVGLTGGWEAAGRSGLWLPTGEQRETALLDKPGISVFTLSGAQWMRSKIAQFS